MNSSPTSTGSKRYCAPQKSQPTSTSPLLGERCVDLVAAEAAQHAGDRARASRCRRSAAPRADERLEAAQRLLPEQAPQDRVGVSVSSSSRVSVAASMRDAVEVLVAADRVFVASSPRAGCIALRRQALDQQAGGDVVVGGEDEPRVELLGLQHVVLEHRAISLQRLARVAMQRHDALVGLLPRAALGGSSVIAQRPWPCTLSIAASRAPSARRRPPWRWRESARSARTSATASLTGPSPKTCRISAPSNLMLACISTPRRPSRRAALHRLGQRRRRLGAARQHFAPAVGEAHEHAADGQARRRRIGAVRSLSSTSLRFSGRLSGRCAERVRRPLRADGHNGGMNDTDFDIARAELAGARRDARAITAWPAARVPSDLAEAYRLQAAVASELGATSGWKVAAVTPAQRESLGVPVADRRPAARAVDARRASRARRP